MQLCRLCALHKYPLVSVADSNSDGFAFVDLIRLYLSIEVEDGSHALLCADCGNTLTKFHQFAGQCRDAQLLLHKPLPDGRTDGDLFADADSKIEINDCGQQIIKKESIKQEAYEDTLEEDNVQSFEYEDCWTPKPEIDIKVRKKKRQKKIIPIVNGADDNSYITGDVLLKLEECEIKTEEITKPKRKYKRRNFFFDEFRIKRTYIKREKIKLFEDTAPLVCYFCSKNGFQVKADLKKHEKTHFTSEKDAWPCPHCERTFKDKPKAVRHIRTVHEGIIDFICHTCGRIFGTKGNLEDHLTTHSDVKNFECDKCGKKFKLKHALKRHLDTHEGTIYQCPKCAMLLNSRRTLTNHLLIHDEVGRHKCAHCSKRFKLRKTLKIHYLTHTGERPYKCPWCVKTFTNNSNCRIHKKRIHPLELMKFEAERITSTNSADTNTCTQPLELMKREAQQIAGIISPANTNTCKHPLELMNFESQRLTDINLSDSNTTDIITTANITTDSNTTDAQATNEHSATQSALYDWTVIKQPSTSISTNVAEQFAIIQARVLNPMFLRRC